MNKEKSRLMNYLPYPLRKDLREDMKQNNLEPPDYIIPDGFRYSYEVIVDGIWRAASYIATLYPIGKKGPLLFCAYGLDDSPNQYTYISSIK